MIKHTDMLALREIEKALARSPLVRACAVVPRHAGGRAELVAHVVRATGAPEVWPSVGEYGAYDELLYWAMTTDEIRMHAYRSAIAHAVRGKTVVEIGTGADLALARLCLDAGAARVFAIELLDKAWRSASRLAEEL